MLAKLIFVVLFNAILALEKQYYDVENTENVNALFENFLREFNKTYVGFERTRRLHIFHANVKDINRLNAEYPLTIYVINYFSDLENEEMDCYKGLNLKNFQEGDGACTVESDPQTHKAPASLDWRDQNAVTPIKDQQSCGSCWAFSATATVESQHAKNTGQQVDLSEQQLIDCDDTDSGCLGGHPATGFTALIHATGQLAEADYPYVNQQGICQFDSSKVQVQVTGCSTYSLSSEDALKELLATTGPLSISIAAASLHKYGGGIWTDCQDSHVDHAVQLVGYGTENGEDFWIIKNSWSTVWGESGFGRIQRGVNCLSLLNPSISSVTTA